MPRNFRPGEPGHVTRGATPAPGARTSALVEKIGDLITDGDIADVMAMLRGALKADVSMRAPRQKVKPEDGGKAQLEPNNYLIAADWPVRLQAGKILLAYKFGNPTDTVSMQLALPSGHAGENPPLTREEMIDQLQSTGTDLKNIVDVWLQGMKTAEKAEPGAPILEIPQTTGPVEVVEV